MRITKVIGREVLDSRGRPTVEAEVHLESGARGRAIAPSGASTGIHEALELRDRDMSRFNGLGVRKAVRSINTTISRILCRQDISGQSDLDGIMIAADGTPNKCKLGANAILAVSLAYAHAETSENGIPLYKHLAELTQQQPRMPLPMINILSGGLHAGGQLDFQDYLVMPIAARSIMEALEWTYAIYQEALKRCIKEAGYNPQLVADEGGIGPNLKNNEAALSLLTKSIRGAGFEPGIQVGIALDVASSHFFRAGKYVMQADKKERTPGQMVDYLERLVGKYPVLSIEDGVSEDDWKGWQLLTSRLGKQIQLLGDDLFVTNAERLQKGIDLRAANAILIKFNQVGTLTETLKAMQVARGAGYRTVVSARSGETEDSTMSDLAVGADGGQIKVGSITRSSRLAKYNQLLRIGEDRKVKHWRKWN